MNINIQPISARDESCTVCGRPAILGKYISGETSNLGAVADNGIMEDEGINQTPETEAVDFGVFFCDDHRHLADREHIESFVLEIIEE